MSIRVHCLICGTLLTCEGHSIHLISDSNRRGFSCAQPPQVYESGKPGDFGLCKCQIRDISCLVCKYKCGHHVVQGCASCLSSPNNGHYWIIMHGEGRTLQREYDDYIGQQQQP